MHYSINCKQSSDKNILYTILCTVLLPINNTLMKYPMYHPMLCSIAYKEPSDEVSYVPSYALFYCL